MMSSSNGNRFLLPACVCLLAVVGGYLLSPVSDKVPPAKAGPAKPELRADLPEIAKDALAPVLAAASPEDRQRAAIVLARKVPAPMISDWLEGEWYPGDGLDGMLFDRILRQRWFDENPADMVDHYLSGGGGDLEEVVRLWVARDPDAVVTWFWQIKDSAALNGISYTCFDGVVRTKPLLALEQVPMIHERLGEIASPWLGGLLIAISKEHREALMGKLPSWPESLRGVAEKALNIRQASDDFPATIARMKNQADGIDQFVAALPWESFSSQVLGRADIIPEGWIAAAAASEYCFMLTDVDPKFWLDRDLVSFGLSDSTVSKLLDLGMSSLINRDPEQAIKLLKRTDLRPRDRREILSNGFLRLATRNPDRAKACLADLTDPKEVASARDTVKNAGGPPPKAPLELTPQKWMIAFAGGQGMTKDQIYSSLDWSTKTIPVLREEFSRLDEKQKSMASLGCVLLDSGRGGKLRGDSSALTWLRADGISYFLKHPPVQTMAPRMNGPDVDASITKFAAGWALEDPASASRWAQEDLPLGAQRIAVLKQVADCWLKNQPNSALEWINSLPQGEQEQIKAPLSAE